MADLTKLNISPTSDHFQRALGNVIDALTGDQAFDNVDIVRAHKVNFAFGFASLASGTLTSTILHDDFELTLEKLDGVDVVAIRDAELSVAPDNAAIFVQPFGATTLILRPQEHTHDVSVDSFKVDAVDDADQAVTDFDFFWLIVQAVA